MSLDHEPTNVSDDKWADANLRKKRAVEAAELAIQANELRTVIDSLVAKAIAAGYKEESLIIQQWAFELTLKLNEIPAVPGKKKLKI